MTVLRVLIVSSGWPTPETPENSIFVAQEAEFLRRCGVEVGIVAYEGRKNPSSYLRARARVRHELRRSRYNIVHAHFGQSWLVVRGCSLPVVITFHGSDLLGVIGPRGRNTMRGRALRLIARNAARCADRVILAGERLASELPSGVPFDVVPAGVDPTIFVPGPKVEARREIGLPADGYLVLFSGSPLVPRKRYELASEAIRLLARRDVTLINVAGVARERVARYMQASDVLLVTSLHESGPLMVKEALACNLPVVSLDVGDVRKRIAGLPGATLCVDDRPETIASGLNEALTYEGVFEGRHRVADVLQHELAERLVAIYRSVVAGDARARSPNPSAE